MKLETWQQQLNEREREGRPYRRILESEYPEVTTWNWRCVSLERLRLLATKNTPIGMYYDERFGEIE